MVEKGIRGGICHAIHRYVKINNKYMKNHDENKESSYIQYLDANNLHGWAISKKLPIKRFKFARNVSNIDEDFIKNYDEDTDKGYILEVDVEHPKDFHDLLSDLPFLPERMKIDKCNKLVCNLYDKKNYVVHIRSLKQALNHGLRKFIKDFDKDFFKLMNNSVFGKTMENVRKHKDIKLVTTDKRKTQLVSEPDYHTTKWF